MTPIAWNENARVLAELSSRLRLEERENKALSLAITLFNLVDQAPDQAQPLLEVLTAAQLTEQASFLARQTRIVEGRLSDIVQHAQVRVESAARAPQALLDALPPLQAALGQLSPLALSGGSETLLQAYKEALDTVERKGQDIRSAANTIPLRASRWPEAPRSRIGLADLPARLASLQLAWGPMVATAPARTGLRRNP